MSAPVNPEWIAVDWGTSRLRAYAMKGRAVLAKAASDDGMGRLAPHEFAPALRRLVAPWLRGITTVVACGMVGARQGWAEAPYRPVPCKPLDGAILRLPCDDIRAFVVGGLSQAAPPDVMRGEETQIAGFLALNPGFDGVLCLPGTHTKWAHLSAGEVVSFRTFMTGELFALLSEQSILRHSLATDATNDASLFLQGVADARARPEALAGYLFSLRAASLLENAAPGSLRARLSGLLIGSELAAARPYWLGQNVAILGLGPQPQAYRDALEAEGVPALMTDTEAATLAGLHAAFQTIEVPG